MQKRDLYYERIPTKLLRDDVRYIGNILGKVIKEQEGQNFFELVEKIRKLSKANNKSLKTWKIPICYDEEFAIDLKEVSDKCKLDKNLVIKMCPRKTSNLKMLKLNGKRVVSITFLT